MSALLVMLAMFFVLWMAVEAAWIVHRWRDRRRP